MIDSFSRLVVGAMRLGHLPTNELEHFVNQSIELGISTFDHADIYGGYTIEKQFGEVLKRNPKLRNELQLVTKFGIKMVHENRPKHAIKSYDTSKEHIQLSVENSLRNLHTDHIDLFLIHRPDVLLDPEEVAEVFTSLKKEGKVLEFGVSNFTPSQFELLNSYIELATNQVEISVLHLDTFQDGTLDQCLRHKVKPMAWSPLGGGEVFSVSDDERIRRIQQEGNTLCNKYNCQLDQLLYAWLLQHPSGIMPVLGTSKIERVRAAYKALDIELEREDWYKLWTASTGKEVA